MPIELKGSHIRIRQTEPVKGSIFRTKDIGQKGHTMLVLMRKPHAKKWVTQSVIMPVQDVRANRAKTVQILKALGVYRSAKQLAGVY
jgi:hypothetical protein